MTEFLTILCVVSAVVVLLRVLQTVSTLDVRKYNGHPLRFAALSLHWALLAAGAVATALGLPLGGMLLLTGLALIFLCDRRRS